MIKKLISVVTPCYNEQENIIIDQTTNEHSMYLMNKQRRNMLCSKLHS